MVNPDTHVLESRTRDRVLRVVSQEGPVSIPALVERLGLTETAVRRHVDGLHADGLVEPRPAAGPRRRGRPAKAWVLTEHGHRALVNDYDDLAGEAVRFLGSTVGADAVQAFAEHRVAGLEQRLADRVATAGDDTAERTRALVDALNTEGFAASARPVGRGGGPLTGIQLCQGHCPVQHVAAEFPQFCEAETEAFSRLLGVHVQRLATLAHGDHVCTTFVPTPTTERPSS
ncbi:transcriptional regulator [Fodinibacter luteus]|uniref:Transcriptional regulator n=1 Tax=Fodinibacter luteus TaxID=552064 RepID=A0ABP8KAB1_9MICO